MYHMWAYWLQSSWFRPNVVLRVVSPRHVTDDICGHILMTYVGWHMWAYSEYEYAHICHPEYAHICHPHMSSRMTYVGIF